MKNPQATAGLAVETTRLPKVRVSRSARLNGRPLRNQPLMRKFEVAHLRADNTDHFLSFLAPALPMFEQAFAGVARGTLVSTELGPMAVEDLIPGDRIQTEDDGFQTLLWRGSTEYVPNSDPETTLLTDLTRVSADAFGLGRPMPDLLLGPGAGLWRNHPGLGQGLIMAPDLQNGETVFSVTPPTPVRLYHLGFRRQHILRVNGLEITSYHPGNGIEMSLSVEMLQLFTGLFPHLDRLSDFGNQRYFAPGAMVAA